ncbi:hypothetical protein EXS71_01045 [Candidatus Uhrbacteria bacterium]|nr:hypothetical protein [Candidatus Uhrbacteria bacterium]
MGILGSVEREEDITKVQAELAKLHQTGLPIEDSWCDDQRFYRHPEIALRLIDRGSGRDEANFIAELYYYDFPQALARTRDFLARAENHLDKRLPLKTLASLEPVSAFEVYE